MAKFTFAVTETRNVECVYTVEADTEEKAREMAEEGETEAEVELQLNGISDRYVGEIISREG